MGVGTSTFVIRWINFLTMLLAIFIIGFGVWMSAHDDNCTRSLTLPVLGLGALVFLISIIGFLGAWKNNSILLWIVSFSPDTMDILPTLCVDLLFISLSVLGHSESSSTFCLQYLIMLCFILVAILVFTVLAFIVTNTGSGHNVSGLRYKEYQLQDYSPWFLKQLNNTHNWNRLKSCLVKSEDCNNLPKKYKTLRQYRLALLTPIEAGCCRPPSECGYPAINASYYDLNVHPVSSNKDCKLYKNSRSVKCYNCDSCKAGVAHYMKTEWRVVAVCNVILFVILSMVYFVGCCARRNAARSRSKS